MQQNLLKICAILLVLLLNFKSITNAVVSRYMCGSKKHKTKLKSFSTKISILHTGYTTKEIFF